MKMLMKAFAALSLLLALSLSFPVKAAEDPVALLDRTTVKMLDALNSNRNEIKSNVNRLYQLIDNILSPHMSYTEMARWVAGRQGWEKSSSSDKTQFTAEFRRLLIRTYSNSLSDLKDVQVTYAPIRSDITGKARIQVSSSVKVPGKESLEVAYRLLRSGDTWLCYDILVEGVSLLKGFQSQYSDDITKLGMAEVTKKIQALNQKGSKK